MITLFKATSMLAAFHLAKTSTSPIATEECRVIAKNNPQEN